MNLVYKNETALLIIALIISIVCWTAILVATKGIALLFLPAFFLLYAFAQSALIAHFKGRGALLSARQFPDLNEKVEAAVEKLQMKSRPDTYLLNGNGVFNAFATKFIGRYYVVLNSSIVDALRDNPDGINFYIGHELGHIKRKHLLWHSILAPALMLPLLGSAYMRACEYTCDLHGAACCANATSAAQGIAVLAVGSKRWKDLDIASYVAQGKETSGFWMSFHELIASYPWLTKRLAQISPDFNGRQPGRNPFAYFFAIFIPRLSIATLLVIYCAYAFAVMPHMMKAMKAERAHSAITHSAPHDDDDNDR